MLSLSGLTNLTIYSGNTSPTPSTSVAIVYNPTDAASKNFLDQELKTKKRGTYWINNYEVSNIMPKNNINNINKINIINNKQRPYGEAMINSEKKKMKNKNNYSQNLNYYNIKNS